MFGQRRRLKVPFEGNGFLPKGIWIWIAMRQVVYLMDIKTIL
jgi:hypothetical protein